jgi:hypothetical protein
MSSFSFVLIAAAYVLIGLYIVLSVYENFDKWDRLAYLENFCIVIFWPAWLTFYWFALERRKRSQPTEIEWTEEPPR